MRQTLAALLALCCAAPAGAQTALDTAQTLSQLDSAVVYDGAKLAGGGPAPVFAPSSARRGPSLMKAPLTLQKAPDLRLDDGRWKARDKGVWLGLGAFVAMESAWQISYHRKHPWGMGPDSPATLASWAGVILFPLIGEQIGKAIDRRRDKRRPVME